MTPVITAFARSPDKGRGLARDMTVRWALEEVGQPYHVRLLSFAEMKEDAHLALQPFGQIPTYEEDGISLFESGAIVLHISQNRPGLMPAAPHRRARAISWLLAAVGTVEPPIAEREQAIFRIADRPWFGELLEDLDQRVRLRLGQLSRRLGDREWLEDEFTAGDLMMAMVLRRLSGTDMLAETANLAAYVTRAEARPAFQRAFAAQRAIFEALAGSDPGD